MTRGLVVLLGLVGAIAGSGWAIALRNMDIGKYTAEKAYYCGYARGMKFVADRQGLNLGPVPISGCERFDHLDELTK